MKYAIIAITAFALTCIGWTTVLVKRAPPVVPAAVAAVGDTAVATHEVQQIAHATPAQVEEPADTTQAPEAGPVESVEAANPAEHVMSTGDSADVETNATGIEPTDVAGQTVAAATAPAREPAVVAGPTEEEKQAAYKALARIFSQMKAEEAAEVLRHMSDVEVEGVVRNLGARKAAEVLTSLPEQRAAALARRLLIPVNEISR